MKNKYAIRSKISEAKIRQIVRLFAVDLDALQIAQIAGVNRNTVNRYLAAFRERIAHFCEAESPVKGEVEVDESYFGARRVRGLRGRGARGKTIVFGLFKRNGRVYTEVVSDCSKPTLQGIIRGRVEPKVLSTQTAGAAMMAWSIWGIRSTSECNMATMNLPINTRILMALKASGPTSRRALCALAGWQNTLFTFI